MIAALCQAIIVKLHKLYTRNQGFRLYRRALIEENKWRAARWGLDGKLIDFGKRAEVPMRDLALELLEFVDDVVDELGQPRGGQLRAHGAGGRHQRRSAARRLPADRRSQGGGAAHRAGNTRRRRRTEEQDDEDRVVVRPRIQLSAGVHRAGEPARASARHHRRDGEVRRHEDGRARRVPGHRRSHLARGRVLPRRAEARGAAGQPTSSTTRSGGRQTTSSSTTR